jgi:glutaredoxin
MLVDIYVLINLESMRTVKSIVALFLLLFVTIAWTNNTPWFSRGENNLIRLRVDLFLSSNCPYCKKADAFFHELEKQTPWIEVHRYIINEDKTALDQFHQELQQQHDDKYTVPAIFFCDSHWIGFDKAETTGALLLQRLQYCQQQITRTGYLDAATINNLRQWAHASSIKLMMGRSFPTALFIPAIALSDAFYSCSMFALFALVAFLWFQQKRTAQLSLGFLFLVVLGIVHSIQLRHSDFLYHYQTLYCLRILAVIIGLGLIAYVLMSYAKRAFHGIALAVLIILTALILQTYQQRCVPNFALIFEQWLKSQNFSLTKTIIYQFIYQVIYLLPLALLVLCYAFLGKDNRWERFRGLLTWAAWSMLLIIGGFLILYPQGLSNFSLSLGALIISLLPGWLMTKFWYKHEQIN